jgi:regulator of replication initiation timing
MRSINHNVQNSCLLVRYRQKGSACQQNDNTPHRFYFDRVCLGTPVLDVSSFYRTELARAIADIRHDFEVLSQSQVNELEDYYRIKTEQVREEIAAEDERKRLKAREDAAGNVDTLTLSSSLKDNHDDLNALKIENQQLQSQLDAILNDLDIRQQQQQQEQQAFEHQVGQLREQINDRQATIDNLLENNVSLRFEMSTYRRLLDVEEKHLNRMEEQRTSGSNNESRSISALASASPLHSQSIGASTDRMSNELATKKMTVQKTARGSTVG